MSIYEIEVTDIEGTKQVLSSKKGKVLLIVNVASKCGFTSQYKGLEELYDKHKAEGFEVLGFPCNQFGSQEPGTEKEIKDFCELTYKVKFPMYSKIDVNGPHAHPLYVFLKAAKPGIFKTEDIKWNFTKFLIDKKGEVINRYAPQATPESIEKDIIKLLK